VIETIKYSNISWTHINNPKDDDFDFLINEYKFHPLDIDDCKNIKNIRPKIDVYDNYYFMNLHFPVYDKFNNFIEIRELKIYWGKKYIITLVKGDLKVKDIFNDEKKNKLLDINNSDTLLYNILNKLNNKTQNVIDKTEQDVNDCGKMIFDKRAEKTIQKISMSRKNIILLNTMIKPHIILFSKLNNGVIDGFAKNMDDYWGNILDYYQKLWDTIEDLGELITGYSTTFDSLQANKTNEVMKILTLISSILLPMTFVASLYGMNIILPLQNNSNSFSLILIIMALIVIIMISYFKFKKWI
jgi:magnesium transporter